MIFRHERIRSQERRVSMDDVEIYMSKAVLYRDRARAETNPKVRAALDALAREYRQRASEVTRKIRPGAN